MASQARATHDRKYCTLVCIFKQIEGFCSVKREAATFVASLRRSLHWLVGDGDLLVYAHLGVLYPRLQL